MARSIHEDYRSRAVADGKEGQGYAVTWEDLPEEVRESNRRAAEAIASSVESIGCDIIPMTGWGRSTFEFTDDEVDTLAKREHERWRAEREADGWTYGAVRDNAGKRNPILLPWDDLYESDRDDNRDAVRDMPAQLARAGFEIIRPQAGPGSGQPSPS